MICLLWDSIVQKIVIQVSNNNIKVIGFVSCLKIAIFFDIEINGPPADKRDLTTKYENLKVGHILKILST